LGSEFRYQKGDVAVMYQAGESDIARIQKPRTTANIESDESAKSPKPQAQHRTRQEKDWISILSEQEAYVSEAVAFYRMIDTSKIIYAVTDGDARPHPGTVSWGAIVRQNKAFTMMWRHFPRATNNTMEISPVAEALRFFPSNMVVCISPDSQYVHKGIT
jgi:hypothetical protein